MEKHMGDNYLQKKLVIREAGVRPFYRVTGLQKEPRKRFFLYPDKKRPCVNSKV